MCRNRIKFKSSVYWVGNRWQLHANSFFFSSLLASCYYIFQNWLRISNVRLFFALIFVRPRKNENKTARKKQQNTSKWRKNIAFHIISTHSKTFTLSTNSIRDNSNNNNRREKATKYILWFQINAVSNPKWNLIAQPKLLIHFSSHKFYAMSTNLLAQNEF